MSEQAEIKDNYELFEKICCCCSFPFELVFTILNGIILCLLYPDFNTVRRENPVLLIGVTLTFIGGLVLIIGRTIKNKVVLI